MKYEIEGGIDFYGDLYKSLDQPENPNEDTNVCLITNNVLNDTHIKLACSHTFNYEPLYNEFIQQKKNHRLSSHQVFSIKCPYCRIRIHNYMPILDGFDKIDGIHFKETASQPYKSSSSHSEYINLSPPTQSQ